ncbi:unnamed protein product [Prorocentrum cordatum]|uniref:Uncharacterized protein n=1 Tax=Prorocentrum cordatum TaxID=2364126 RepID=A0ABN9UR72_9DINO|nr:unnamed protein product [Polarella glacialis]
MGVGAPCRPRSEEGELARGRAPRGRSRRRRARDSERWARPATAPPAQLWGRPQMLTELWEPRSRADEEEEEEEEEESYSPARGSAAAAQLPPRAPLRSTASHPRSSSNRTARSPPMPA